VSRVKYFLDTEFIENGPHHPIDLLSIGIVCEDGRELYAISSEADLSSANPWVQEHVLPHLGDQERQPLATITNSIKALVGNKKPEVWAYFSSYDWVIFCQMFETMANMPEKWPTHCNDLKIELDRSGIPRLPKQTSIKQNSLNDARWTKDGYFWLQEQLITRPTISLV
jgi:hypothetical protein